MSGALFFRGLAVLACVLAAQTVPAPAGAWDKTSRVKHVAPPPVAVPESDGVAEARLIEVYRLIGQGKGSRTVV